METNSERYYRLLKSLKCPHVENLSPKVFDYLFLIPETRQFFDWLLDNVDENCLITDKQKFIQIATRGHVITDAENIQQMDRIFNLTSNLTNESSGESWEQSDDPQFLEQILKKKQDLYERELNSSEKEKELYERFKTMSSNKLLELKRVETQKENLIEHLDEKDDNLKGLYKHTNQNLHKLRIELQTKFGDESGFISSIEDFDGSDLGENYVKNEKLILKNLNILSTFVPRSGTLTISSDESRTKSKLYDDIYKKVNKNYIDKRIIYHSCESDLRELRFYLDNFDSFFAQVNEKLNKGGNDYIQEIENQILFNTKQSQYLTGKTKEISRKLLLSSYEAFRFRELEWKLVEAKRRYVSLSLIRTNQEKIARILGSLKMRKNFILTLFKIKLANAEAIMDLLEEIMVDQNSSILQPSHLSSTHLISGGSQSPSKWGENQFIHILNQFLISALRRWDFDFNRTTDADLFKLKNPISTSFSVNLDTYVDLAEQVRANCRSGDSIKQFDLVFNACFDLISSAVRYVYDQDDKKSTGGMEFNLKRLNLTKNAKILDEKLKSLNKEKEDLHSFFLTNIHQILQNYKAIVAKNDFLRIKRDFFVYFYTSPKNIESIIEHLNNI